VSAGSCGSPSRSAYTAGCRCDACRAENRAYRQEHGRQLLYGTYDGLVDAAPAREHVARLRASGIGTRRIAELAGLNESVVRRVARGLGPADPPSRRVRRKTAEAILAVRPRLEDMAPSRIIDSTGSRRRIQALAAIGIPLREVSRRAGWRPTRASGILVRGHITARCALDVRRVYDELWNASYRPQDGYRAEGARKAIEHAREMGWAPPMAWDDDAIDDPAAKPAGMRHAAYRV
jgi:hypothetical protein